MSSPTNRLPQEYRRTPPADDLARTPISDVYGLVPLPHREEPRRGRRVFYEVLLCTLVFPLSLVTGAGWLGARFVDVEGSRRVARAGHLMHETQEAVGALSWDAIARMHGTAVLEHATPAASEFRVDLSVRPAGQDLLKVEGILRDNRTSLELSRFSTYRARS